MAVVMPVAERSGEPVATGTVGSKDSYAVIEGATDGVMGGDDPTATRIPRWGSDTDGRLRFGRRRVFFLSFFHEPRALHECFPDVVVGEDRHHPKKA